MAKLDLVREELGDCQRCKLCETRTNIVFGNGDPNTKWLFVGEAPGADEDRLSEPFVGKAGQLLNHMIKESGWSRETVFVANVVKCRPPNNRNPAPDEIAACKPFLFHQIQTIQPLVITTLGRPAANLLLNSKEGIGKLRGKEFELLGATVVPTYHPSYIQRGNWGALDLMKDDFAKALAILMGGGVLSPNWTAP